MSVYIDNSQNIKANLPSFTVLCESEIAKK